MPKTTFTTTAKSGLLKNISGNIKNVMVVKTCIIE